MIHIGKNISSAYSNFFDCKQMFEWREKLYSIYSRMRSKKDEYIVRCDDIDIIVLPNVYAPCFFTDSLWFANILPGIVGKDTFLEIGCGTGILSVKCALNGAQVVATDINPDAIRNTKMNAELNQVDVKALEGSIYAPLRSNERFNFIFWAHPFNNADYPVDDMLLMSGFDYNYNGLKEYVRGASEHLNKEGRLLLGSGSTADLLEIEKIALDNGYSLRVLKSIDMLLEDGGDANITYLLIEFISEK